jgi:TPR repeat protein
MFYYAQCLEAGVGLEADPAEARKWYEQAAAKGDTRAVAKLREAAK